MIQANELRIGNWVEITGVKVKLTGPKFLFILQEDGDLTTRCEPIELTLDILEKCGFEKLPHCTVGNTMIKDIGRQTYLSISNITDPNQMVWLCSRNDKDDRKVEDLICVHNFDYDGWMYLHQLQNLYFALTHTELTVQL